MTEQPTLPTTLPAHPYGPDGRGRVFAFMTGERVTPESAEHGDAEERGWISPDYSMTTFFDSRNDVAPVMSEPVYADMTDEEREILADAVADALERLGAYADNGDGTFYGQDSRAEWSWAWDVPEGDYTYAIHFVVKYRDPSRPDAEPFAGYVERSWHPSEAGITTG